MSSVGVPAHKADGLYFTSRDQLSDAVRDHAMRGYVQNVFWKSAGNVEHFQKVPVTLALVTKMQQTTKCVGALTNAMQRAGHITPQQCSTFMNRYGRIRFQRKDGPPDQTRKEAALLFMDLLAKRARREGLL